ncbi:hypothetical protein MRB53_005198 [Persea americana]|uniref:Uncharacterized protein n=1 Tax=Persea americana TaxID=3435 RepID=A0ACC2MCM9_PERAE|nr:hypothetical protein MRB53_005198 [Persea americana]
MGDKAELLEAVLKETVDLENIPIEEVFENLRCSKEGLTSEAADERLTIFGHNKLEEKKRVFKVSSLQKTAHDDFRKLASAIYLQIATLIAVYAKWSFAAIEGIGWGWAGVVWLYNIIFYFPLDPIKFIIRYALSGKAWDLVIEQRIAFTRQKDFGKEARELKWAHAQRTLHGLHPPETKMFNERSNFTDLNQMAEEARRRAEIARLRELTTLKGHVESVVRLKGLDIDTIQQAYTV